MMMERREKAKTVIEKVKEQKKFWRKEKENRLRQKRKNIKKDNGGKKSNR